MGGDRTQADVGFGALRRQEEESKTAGNGGNGAAALDIVKISQEEMHAWIQTVRRLNGLLPATLEAARRGDISTADRYGDEAQRRLDEFCARMTNAVTGSPLAGGQSASPDFPGASPGEPSEEEIAGFLSSPTAQEYARALRRAAELAVAADKERGWYPDGPSQTVCDWADVAEFEAFGETRRCAAP